MASKNIFSLGYTQLPVLASAPVSVSWFTGHALLVAPAEWERGIVETTRSVPRGPPGRCGCCWCGCCGDDGGCWSVDDDVLEERNGIRGHCHVELVGFEVGDV